MRDTEHDDTEGALQGEVGSAAPPQAAPPQAAGDEPASDADAAPPTPDDAQTAPADETAGEPSGTHTSTVTDLPEGAEVDPLTDRGPEAVVDAPPADE